MQELIVNILLVVVAVLAGVLRLIGQRPDSGMTKKQKVMLWRIFIASVLLIGLQSLGTSAFNQRGGPRAEAGPLSGGLSGHRP